MLSKSSKKNRKIKNIKKNKTIFSNLEIVTLSVYLLGGDSSYIDTEDIAVKVNELAPGRFSWRKYPDQINIDNVRKRLSDAKNPQKGGYIIGSFNEGWILTANGLGMCKKRMKELKGTNVSRPPIDQKQLRWQQREKTRMLSTAAFEKITLNNENEITIQEAEAFFRLDEYIVGKAREKKLNRYINSFTDDPKMGELVKKLAKKVRQNER